MVIYVITRKLQNKKVLLVGGGFFVNKNYKKNFVYYGVPAKPIRKRKKSEKYY